MNVFWGEQYLLTDEQLEVVSKKTFSVCKGQGARGESVTQLHVNRECGDAMKASNSKTCWLLAIVLGAEMVVFKVVGGAVFLWKTSGQ